MPPQTSPGIRPTNNPELFFGLVGAVGTDLSKISAALRDALRRVNYTTTDVSLIEQLAPIKRYSRSLQRKSIFKRYLARMDAGDDFRDRTGLGDALALLSIISIRAKHRRHSRGSRSLRKPIPRRAYILKSLKHPEEVETFRRVYGPNFYLISAYTPRDIRIQNLVSRIAESNYDSQKDKYRHEAELLVARDEDDPKNKFGQKVRATFPKADCFIDARDPAGATEAIQRFIELLFGNTFLTPSKTEYGMFHAQAAAFRSAALGRQVGAAIATAHGDITAVGTNEVPKFGGGQYWSDDSNDNRDYHLGFDPSDKKKKEVLAEVLRILKEQKWIRTSQEKGDVDALVEKSMLFLKGTRLMNLTEFGRVVHAEMAALLDAARRGIEVKNCILYTSTFPCHECTRHIVAAGIKQVIYVEPYPKSLAQEFHIDSIAVDSSGSVSTQVSFEPFVGVAPRLYMKVFEMTERKNPDGSLKRWNTADASPRFALSHNYYIDAEVDEAALFVETLDQKRVQIVNK